MFIIVFCYGVVCVITYIRIYLEEYIHHGDSNDGGMEHHLIDVKSEKLI